MSRSTLEITRTRPQHWQYVSEGGATIVLSYTGQQPPFLRKVLRLRKRLLGPASSHHTADVHEDDEGEVSVLTFQKRIVERLVPLEFLPVLEYVSVDRPWLEEIASVCDQDRPPGRREKDVIDVAQTRAILATDLVGDVPLVIEIKVCSNAHAPTRIPLTLFFTAKVVISTVSTSFITHQCSGQTADM
jgi:inositol-pentakisphosphate 2-kinase